MPLNDGESNEAVALRSDGYWWDGLGEEIVRNVPPEQGPQPQDRSPRSSGGTGKDKEEDPLAKSAYPSYLRAHSARPNAVNRTICEAVRRDIAPLMCRILGDVGIEYIMRHCMFSPEDGDIAAGRTLFWTAAFHDSGRVLNLLAEACQEHLVRKCNGNQERARKAFLRLLTLETKAGSSPLHIAAARNSGDATSTLLALGVNPNSTNSRGATAAAVAASRDAVSVLRALASFPETNLDLAGNDSPLLYACRSGAVGALKFLYSFRRGENSIVNFARVDAGGYGPAALAAANDRFDAVMYLCEVHDPAGRDRPLSPDVNAKFVHPSDQNHPYNGDSPLHTAVRRESMGAVRAFLQSPACDTSARNLSGMTPLHVAASEEKVVVARHFLNDLSRVELEHFDTEDIFGRTPLYMACEVGNADMVQILALISDVGNLCSVNTATNQKRLESSDENFGGLEDSGEGLKRSFASTQAGSAKGKASIPEPALFAAVRSNNPETVSALLAARADINQTDERGHTAVSIAARMGLFEACEILVENGADLSKRSRRGGKTPLQKAKKYGHKAIVTLLESYEC